MVAQGAARKPANAKVTIAAPDDGAIDGVPVPEIPSLRSVPDREDDKAEAFNIDGVSYYIDRHPRLNKALRHLHITRTQGTEAAIDYMLETLLGAEGYEALMSFDDLELEDLQRVIMMATQIMNGAVEGPKEKRKRG